MTEEYFKTIKPYAMFRTWYTPKSSSDNEFDFGIYLTFYFEDSEVEDKGTGKVKRYTEDEVFKEEYTELNYIINDFYSFDFDTIK